MKAARSVLCLIALATIPGLAVAASCPSSNVIENPPPFTWTPVDPGGPDEHFVGTLEIAEQTLIVGGETITTRIYRQPGGPAGIPGPTLNFVPGYKYVLQFRNQLPYQPASTDHNVLKDPNVSNLHTHGLHISGESPGDDVTRSFEGSTGGDFVYDIPADHMGGTFWYHAHHHGSTFLQVSAGAFGLIVVDDASDGLPANVASMKERHMVVAYLDPDVAGTGGDTLITGSLSPTWTVNGKVEGSLCMPENTWEHWRLLLADRDAREKTVSVGPQCEMQLLARDGVWRTLAPKELTTRSLSLTGASRADIAVRCSGDTTLDVGGATVAHLVVDADLPRDLVSHPWDSDGESQWPANRPDYLQDLRGTPADQLNTDSVNMGARTINGSKFEHDVPTFVLDTNLVQDWTLKGARNHPFHLHIYHVQVQSDCGSYEGGEYYDVVSGNCNIRFDLRESVASPYRGRTIMHCHILEHEDQGAMGWADVLGGRAAPLFPGELTPGGGNPYGYYDYAANEPPPAPNAPTNLIVTLQGDDQALLGWDDNSVDEAGFDIERQDNGGGFNYLDSSGADSPSYLDSGLAPDSTYDYRVRAVNGSFSGYSNTASVTTPPSPVATEVRVRSITLDTVNVGKGQKGGRAVVVVEGDDGQVVADALVSGAFSGTFNDDISDAGPSDADGSVTISTAESVHKRDSVTLEFCVTAVSHPSLTDFSAAYGEVCGNL